MPPAAPLGCAWSCATPATACPPASSARSASLPGRPPSDPFPFQGGPQVIPRPTRRPTFEVPRGAYPERVEPRKGRLDQLAARATGGLARWLRTHSQRWERIARLVAAEGPALEGIGDQKVRELSQELRRQLRREGFRAELVARAFALVREVAGRTLGQRHFDVQLIGGWVLLNGMVAEMETGEGKTLTATLAASTAALAGLPVHVITVNDYLAARDAEWMGPIYRALGLTVGLIAHGMDPQARRAAYGCEVTYCTNKEVVFDYLRDRIALGRQPGRIHLQLERLYGEQARVRQLLLRGLCYAIVDEADSVLIDEARTPLIISGTGGGATEQPIYQAALSLAGQLEAGSDFALEGSERRIRLTPAGEARLGELAHPLGGVWTGRHRREELVRQALTAQHLFLRDKHYLVRDEKVQIIDEYTGRIMEDRSWEHGLHQLIEAKEGCPLTPRRDSLARISYQRFFRRYLRLSGMTGTMREMARELWSVYRLAVVSIPTNRPLRRRRHPDRVYPTAAVKWKAVVEQIASLHREGRPILVGTRSVAASEHLGQLLTGSGLPHRVLNARQDQEEAQIVAQAGEPGRITVATNLAGRGTDIRLSPGVAELGGLHVIATERHEARRIDRQLFGRCGRQGDPGSCQAILSPEDEIVALYGGRLWRRLTAAMAHAPGHPLPSWIGRLAFRRAQRAAERLHSRIRRDLLKLDEQLDSTLAFSGRRE
ncbi:MAG: preprotein translocase subunit SecA [Candidatus Tectomicrobia bacterium]|uniref:Protein translocase subunit SecA n=1 Tax=Tectimicrobiota bacterium TaxID=2528274 RepID=A0A932CLV9_UNCTE|nr:preprotein translocase subunit SecA [Candidatus Tectomicrobia bacterium]